MNIPILINLFACLVYFSLAMSAILTGTLEDITIITAHSPTFFALVAIFWLIYIRGMDK